jgi:hypothetical protein
VTLEGDYPAMTVANGGHHLAETVTLATIDACIRNLKARVESAPVGVVLGKRQWARLREEIPALPEQMPDSNSPVTAFADAGGLYSFPVYLGPVDDFFEWRY